MPRKFELNWDKKLKYFYKRINGKKVYFGRATSKYLDADGYAAAVEKYHQHMSTLTIAEIKSDRSSRNRLDTKFRRPVDTLAGAIDRYYVMQKQREEAGDITTGRVSSLRSSMRLFERFLGTGIESKTYDKDGIKKHLIQQRMVGYFTHLQNKIKKGQYVTLTAHQHWCIAKDFAAYCYESGWIDKPIKGLNRYKFKSNVDDQNRFNIQTLSVNQITKLYQHAKDHIQYPMELWILLALNTGFTAIDIGTLKFEHLEWDNDHENIIRIKKHRTKTKQYGNWLVWKETNILLKRWLQQRSEFPQSKIQHPEYIFFGRSGQRVTESRKRILTHKKAGLIHRETGYHADAIGTCWNRMIKEHFPEWRGLSFKLLRKSAVSEIVKMNLNNTLLIEQLFLAHKPKSVARMFYTKVSADTLDIATQKLSEVYSLGQYAETYDQRQERRRKEYNAKKLEQIHKRKAYLRDYNKNRRTK